MENTKEVIGEKDSGRPVIINNETGSEVTVNIEVTNCYNVTNTYTFPEWFDQAMVQSLIEAMIRAGGR